MGSGGLREVDAVVLVQRLPAVLAREGEVHAVGDVGVVGLLLGGGGAVVGGQRRRLVLRQQREVEGLRHGRLGRALAGDLDGDGGLRAVVPLEVDPVAVQSRAGGVDGGRGHALRGVRQGGAVGEEGREDVLGGGGPGAFLGGGARGDDGDDLLARGGDAAHAGGRGERDLDRLRALLGLRDPSVLGDHGGIAAAPGDLAAGRGQREIVVLDPLGQGVEALEQLLGAGEDLVVVVGGVLGAGGGDLLGVQSAVVDAEGGDFAREQRIGPRGASDRVHRLLGDRGGLQLGAGAAHQVAVDVEREGVRLAVEHAGQGVPAVGLEVRVRLRAALAGVGAGGDRGARGVLDRAEEVVRGVALRPDVPQEVVLLPHLLVDLHLGGDRRGARLGEQVVGQAHPGAGVRVAAAQAQGGPGPGFVPGVLHDRGLAAARLGHGVPGGLGELVLDHGVLARLRHGRRGQRHDQRRGERADGASAQPAEAAVTGCPRSHGVRTPSSLSADVLRGGMGGVAGGSLAGPRLSRRSLRGRPRRSPRRRGGGRPRRPGAAPAGW